MSADRGADLRDDGIAQSAGENDSFTGALVGAGENSQASSASNIQVGNRELTTTNISINEEISVATHEDMNKSPEIEYQQMASEPSKEIVVESCLLPEGNNQPIVLETNPELVAKDNNGSTYVHLRLTDIVNAVQVLTGDHSVLTGDHSIQEERVHVEQQGEATTVGQAQDIDESAREGLTVHGQAGITSVEAQAEITALNQGLTDPNNASIELHPSLVVGQPGVVDGSILGGIENDGLPQQTTQFLDISSDNPSQNMEISSDFGNVMVNTLNLLPSHRKDPKVYACNFCIKTFSQPHQLLRHERMHTGEKPYVCDICGKGCSQKGDLARHKRKHTGERPYKCDLCEKAYFKSADLKYHKRKHTGEKPYKCTVCDKSFTGLTTLRYHTRTHTGEKPYECETCKKRFAQSSSLKLHKTTHSTDKPFECDLCDKTFSSAPGFKHHRSTHTGDKTHKAYQCEICNKSLSHLSSLICHKRTHTGEKPFKCDQCEKAYSQSFDLKRHKEIHTGCKSHVCEVCDKAFYWAVNLREHRKQHEDKKPFKCDACNKTFAWSSALGHHKRRHSGDKPFKCETCGKTFAATGYLNRHIKSKHPNTEKVTDPSDSSIATPVPTSDIKSSTE